MNALLLNNYHNDCLRALKKWNTYTEEIGFEFKIPSLKFNRQQGVYAGLRFDVDGNYQTEAQWEANLNTILPTQADYDYVQSLMKPVFEVGKIANSIAPPRVGINKQGFDYEYVQFSSEPYNRLA